METLLHRLKVVRSCFHYDQGNNLEASLLLLEMMKTVVWKHVPVTPSKMPDLPPSRTASPSPMTLSLLPRTMTSSRRNCYSKTRCPHGRLLRSTIAMAHLSRFHLCLKYTSAFETTSPAPHVVPVSTPGSSRSRTGSGRQLVRNLSLKDTAHDLNVNRSA